MSELLGLMRCEEAAAEGSDLQQQVGPGDESVVIPKLKLAWSAASHPKPNLPKTNPALT